MAAVQVVLVVHIEACLIAPGRLQDRGYDGASRPEYFGTTWFQLYIYVSQLLVCVECGVYALSCRMTTSHIFFGRAR